MNQVPVNVYWCSNVGAFYFYFYFIFFVEGTPEIPKNLRLEYQTYSLMCCHLSCG